MAQFIDEQFWQQALREPDWYLKLEDDFRRLEKLADKARIEGKDPMTVKTIKREAYALIERNLKEGTIPLAESGEDFDQERRPIDTIVIHHTKNPSGMTLDRLNAMHLLRLYAAYYGVDENLRGQPIYSNHFRDGRQVFYGYHWLVRQDGHCERLLEDEQIGWHSGCWHVNTRSIAIAIDDDLTDSQPDHKVLSAIATLIKANYAGVPPHLVIGHCEVLANSKVIDNPGKLFLSYWKQKLLDLL